MKALIKSILFFALLVSFSYSAVAATIYGNIYDLSLNKVSGARVEVNTTPQQYLISKDGSYSFDIPNGFYTIKAELRTNGVVASETRNISVNKEGNYVIDLILFPNFEEEDDISQDIGIAIPETGEKSFVSLFVLVFVFVLGIIFYFIFKGRRKEKEEKEDDVKEDNEKDLNDLIKIIKQEGGRTTQREIRKQIPLSEAKISLMIAELDHKGLIEKIKKGRGNIIILKRR